MVAAMAVIGIDLGTSNSAAAALRGGVPGEDPERAGRDPGRPANTARVHRRTSRAGWHDGPGPKHTTAGTAHQSTTPPPLSAACAR